VRVQGPQGLQGLHADACARFERTIGGERLFGDAAEDVVNAERCKGGSLARSCTPLTISRGLRAFPTTAAGASRMGWRYLRDGPLTATRVGSVASRVLAAETLGTLRAWRWMEAFFRLPGGVGATQDKCGMRELHKRRLGTALQDYKGPLDTSAVDDPDALNTPANPRFQHPKATASWGALSSSERFASSMHQTLRCGLW
jgi:hypothetical protein